MLIPQGYLFPLGYYYSGYENHCHRKQGLALLHKYYKSFLALKTLFYRRKAGWKARITRLDNLFVESPLMTSY